MLSCCSVYATIHATLLSVHAQIYACMWLISLDSTQLFASMFWNNLMHDNITESMQSPLNG